MRPPDAADRGDPPLVDFARAGRRLRAGATVLAGAAAVAAAGDGLRSGLSVAGVVRWAALFVAGLLLLAAMIVALQAYRGAGTAQGRGQRLAGDDVGLVPPRRRPLRQLDPRRR